MTVSQPEHRRTPSNTEMDTTLIAYMSRRLGLGWEDIAQRLPDIPRDVIKAVVFCKPERTTARERGAQPGR